MTIIGSEIASRRETVSRRQTEWLEPDFADLVGSSGWETDDCTCPEFCERDHANE